MTGNRKRRDLLPPPEFDGAPAIHPGGLSFTAVNEDGTESRVITLEKLPGAPRLRTELLLALAELNGPRKRWRSIYSLKTGYDKVSAFLRWLDDQGHQPQSVADISVATWDAWVLRNGGAVTVTGTGNISMVRAVLMCVPGRSQALTQAMSRRLGQPAPTIQESYTEADYRRIRRAARKAVHGACRRISANFEIVLRFQAGADMTPDEKARARVLLEVMKHGTSQSKSSYKGLGAWSDNARPLTRRAQRSLFLTPHEAWACAVLLAAEAGWNRSVIHRLGVPDNSAGAGDDIEVYTMPLKTPQGETPTFNDDRPRQQWLRPGTDLDHHSHRTRTDGARGFGMPTRPAPRLQQVQRPDTRVALRLGSPPGLTRHASPVGNA